MTTTEVIQTDRARGQGQLVMVSVLFHLLSFCAKSCNKATFSLYQ